MGYLNPTQLWTTRPWKSIPAWPVSLQYDAISFLWTVLHLIMELESNAFFLGIFHWQSNQNYLLYLSQSNGDKDTWYFGMLGYLTYDPVSESLIIPVTSHRFRSQNKWKIRHLLSGYKAIYTMKIKTYCFDTVSVSINLTQNPSVWLTLVMWEGFCGLSADRLQKMWENSWTQKNQKSTR